MWMLLCCVFFCLLALGVGLFHLHHVQTQFNYGYCAVSVSKPTLIRSLMCSCQCSSLESAECRWNILHMFGYKNADTFIIFIEFIEFIMCTIVNLTLRMHRKMKVFINWILFIFTFSFRNIDQANIVEMIKSLGTILSAWWVSLVFNILTINLSPIIALLSVFSMNI